MIIMSRRTYVGQIDVRVERGCTSDGDWLDPQVTSTLRVRSVAQGRVSELHSPLSLFMGPHIVLGLGGTLGFR